MRHKPLFLCFVLIITAVLVYGVSTQPHLFSSGECNLCHVDEKNDPMNIKSEITVECKRCHSEMDKSQSHPTDIYPSFSIPDDMPLLSGKLTCITCHYTHYQNNEIQFIKKNYFLRRPALGIAFCSSCHRISEKQHVVIDDVHINTYKVFNSKTRIDIISLTCIECHDHYLSNPVESLGAGVWKHYSRKANHPIGISYEKAGMAKPGYFRPAEMLSDEIKLFGGKIGCGTCHNVYSREKFQLVNDNRGSRLCLQCHIK